MLGNSYRTMAWAVGLYNSWFSTVVHKQLVALMKGYAVGNSNVPFCSKVFPGCSLALTRSYSLCHPTAQAWSFNCCSRLSPWCGLL